MLIPLTPISEQTLVVGATPVGITLSNLQVGSDKGAVIVWAVVEVISGKINYNFLGGTPDSNSHFMGAGESMVVTSPATWRAVRNGATDAIVRVTVFS